ncbi:hypothetical protein OKW21_004062 [Catalinimonas alkaloidigena]|uniref:RagB/SusD family nutrient uptake outer membrane protein n=1 Tax=Catalinimonas alkaloidigena TaxID=1075417 RepID=UPI0024076CF0|nr:RagB/SusD family nutrient uptake outer membrane protein [Catalinimonas alkaloidigena]MDF9798799.1 hypothetical protein [Catalinimonas alkaloidigena]
MNHYIKHNIAKALIGSFMLLLLSCNELDLNPLDQISGPTFWNSQADAEMALAGVYSTLNNPSFTFPMVYYSVLGGDSEQSGISGTGPINNLAAGEVEANSGGLVSDIYANCYVGIAACNNFLANIERTDIKETTLNQYKGEVLFLRAFFYFRLTEFYGGVPLYTAPITLEEAKVQQSTKEAVVTQILSDLDEAIAYLPSEIYNGHAVKASALALKSRVLLHQGAWQEAAAVAREVMTDGRFMLYEDFKNLFLHYGQDNNPEILFSTRFLNPDNFNQQDIQLQWWGILNPRQELVDAYECTDGLPINASPLYDPDDWKANRDPRMLLTLKAFEDPAVLSSGEVVEYDYNNPSSTGYEPAKFVDVEELPVDYSTRSEHDWILIRYAEVLLNYAEAQNEAVGPDPSVYAAVNEVRARPGIDMPPLPSGLSQDEMRTRIRNERRVELALEGLRYSDIKRWKTAETYIPTLLRPNGAYREFDPSKHYLFPFPQSEMDINNNLKQNPGY